MSTPSPASDPELAARMAQLEARVAALEARLGGASTSLPQTVARSVDDPGPILPLTEAVRGAIGAPATPVDFEYEVGQAWFARGGITVLTLGTAFLLTLPYSEWTATAPPLVGLLVSATLFFFARAGRQLFPLVSHYVRAAGMALCFWSVLRLCYFGHPSALAPDSVLAVTLLTWAALLNLFIAWRRRSPALMSLAIVTAMATPVATGNATLVLLGGTIVSALVLLLARQARWLLLLPLGVGLVFLGYLSWASGNALFGQPYHWNGAPATAPFVALTWIAALAAAPYWHRRVSPDAPLAWTAALLTCSLGYGAILLHTAATNDPRFGLIHLLSSTIFIGLAAISWHRYRSQLATFFYAMCGYGALTMAILKYATVPNVFVWLSLESVVVVATAIWFRSRFIVVTNFGIYSAVVLAYMLLNAHETGVSIAFGLVALVSARILNWQRHRLVLKTDIMRNAYLISAFVVFPYALYHLVPANFTAIAWIGLACMYYGLNLIVQNRKYRWMGHTTLLLTLVFLVFGGAPGTALVSRILSFLALGLVLLVVSLSFTRRHARDS